MTKESRDLALAQALGADIKALLTNYGIVEDGADPGTFFAGISGGAGLDSTAIGRAVLNAIDKEAAREAIGLVTTTPGADEVQLLDPTTIGQSKLLSWVAPSPISQQALNTTAETVLATLPYSGLLAGDSLRMTGSWDVFNNSGAAVTFTFRLRQGSSSGTVVWATAAISHAANANRMRWVLDVQTILRTLTDQRWSGSLGQTFVSGVDGFNGTNSLLLLMQTSTIDLTADSNFVLTGQMSAASSSADIRLRNASLLRNR